MCDTFYLDEGPKFELFYNIKFFELISFFLE